MVDHCFPYTKPVKRSLEKLPEGEKREEVGRTREIITIKKNRGKKWGGKGGAGDAPQPFAGTGMLIRGAVGWGMESLLLLRAEDPAGAPEGGLQGVSVPAEGAVGPSGSRRGAAWGARCSRGAASGEGARGARGAAAARGDLWGHGGQTRPTEPQITSQTSLQVPPTPTPTARCAPAWPTLPLWWGKFPETRISPKTLCGAQNHPKTLDILMEELQDLTSQ